MKHAQQHLQASKAVANVLGVDQKDYSALCTPTLRLSTWHERTSPIEKRLRAELSDTAPLTNEARLALVGAVTDYHRLQATRARLVPLTVQQWQDWAAILHVCAARADAYDSMEELSVEWRTAYVLNAWGTRHGWEAAWAATHASLTDAAARWPALLSDGALAAGHASDGNDRVAGPSAESRLTHVCAPLLQRLTLAAYSAEAFRAAPLLVHTEACESFLFPLLVAVEEMDDGAADAAVLSDPPEKNDGSRLGSLVESWIRQSFKHAFSVPDADDDSASGGSALALQESYTEFEADDAKREAMERFVRDTQHEQLFEKWRLAASSLESARERSVQVNSADGPTDSNSETANGLHSAFAALLHVWEGQRSVDGVAWSSSSPAFRCLSLCMRRFIEFDAFPGTCRNANLLLALYHLQRWFSRYLVGQHRWSFQSPFWKEDDSDLWAFVIERHEVLLRHATAAASVYAAEQHEEGTQHLTRVLSAASAVVWSLVHSLQTYLSLLGSADCRATGEKKAVRSNAAVAAVSQWLRTYLVTEFSLGFMNDVYDELESGNGNAEDGETEERSQSQAFAAEVDIVTIEAELKILISDVLCAVEAGTVHGQLQSTASARQRLRPLFTDAMHLASSTFVGEAPDGVFTTLNVEIADARRLLATLHRLLTRLSAAALGAHASSLSVASASADDRELLRLLVEQGKQLTRLLASPALRTTDDPLLCFLHDRTAEELTRLLTAHDVRLPSSPQSTATNTTENTGDSSATDAPVCAASYLDPSITSKKGGRERLPLGGVMDVVCENFRLRSRVVETGRGAKRPRSDSGNAEESS